MSPARTLSTLKEALEIPGLSGHEEEFVDWYEARARRLGARTSRTKLGSCIALLPAKAAGGRARRGARAKRLMIAAHADAIGMLVTAVTPEGFLRVAPLGGIDPRVLPAQDVWVHGTRTVPGVFGSVPPHFQAGRDGTARLEMDDLFVDIGFGGDSARQLVRVGDLVSFRGPGCELLGDRLCGRAMDNRASVVSMLHAMELLSKRAHKLDVYGVATVQEEAGAVCGGAMTATFELEPDVALAVDVTHGEIPGSEDWQTFKLGAGPSLVSGPNAHPGVLRILVDSAKAEKIPYHIEPAPTSSFTDAMDIQPGAGGVATGIVGIPLRYMHSSVETLSLKDVDAVSRLLARFAVKAEGGWERED